jgi:hypothetical protein
MEVILFFVVVGLLLIPMPLAFKSMSICEEINRQVGRDLHSLSDTEVLALEKAHKSEMKQAMDKFNSLRHEVAASQKGASNDAHFAMQSMAQARDMMSEPSLRDSAQEGMFAAEMLGMLSYGRVENLQYQLEQQFNRLHTLADRNNAIEYEINKRNGGLAIFLAGYKAAVIHLFDRLTGKNTIG